MPVMFYNLEMGHSWATAVLGSAGSQLSLSISLYRLYLVSETSRSRAEQSRAEQSRACVAEGVLMTRRVVLPGSDC